MLEVDLSEATQAQVFTKARDARLPVELYGTLTVEAARQTESAVALFDLDFTSFVNRLNEIASEPLPRELAPPALRRLREYALALRRGEECEVSTPKPLRLIVPDDMRAAWTIAAGSARMGFGVWVNEQLRRDLPEAHLWEASAAYAAQSLEAWVLTQATRARRSANTFAQLR